MALSQTPTLLYSIILPKTDNKLVGLNSLFNSLRTCLKWNLAKWWAFKEPIFHQWQVIEHIQCRTSLLVLAIEFNCWSRNHLVCNVCDSIECDFIWDAHTLAELTNKSQLDENRIEVEFNDGLPITISSFFNCFLEASKQASKKASILINCRVVYLRSQE